MNGWLLYLFHLPTLQTPDSAPPCRKQRFQNLYITQVVVIFYKPLSFFLFVLTFAQKKEHQVTDNRLVQRFLPFLKFIITEVPPALLMSSALGSSSRYILKLAVACCLTQGQLLICSQRSHPCDSRVSPSPFPPPTTKTLPRKPNTVAP